MNNFESFSNNYSIYDINYYTSYDNNCYSTYDENTYSNFSTTLVHDISNMRSYINSISNECLNSNSDRDDCHISIDNITSFYNDTLLPNLSTISGEIENVSSTFFRLDNDISGLNSEIIALENNNDRIKNKIHGSRGELKNMKEKKNFIIAENIILFLIFLITTFFYIKQRNKK